MSGEPLFRLGTRVDSLDVRAYLEARGWSRVPSRRPYAAIYRSAREPLVEVQVPLDRDLADYGDAMVVIARRVSEWEGRPVESVLHDLLQPWRDSPRFGLEGDSTREMQRAQFVGQVSELMGAPGEQGAVEGPVVLQVASGGRTAQGARHAGRGGVPTGCCRASGATLRDGARGSPTRTAHPLD